MRARTGAAKLLMLGLLLLAHAAAAHAEASCQKLRQCEAGQQTRWQPSGKLSWTIDYSAGAAASRLSAPARDAYVLPLHEVAALARKRDASGANVIDDLTCRHGRRLICYTNCGAWEAEHWDETLLDPVRGEMLGKPMQGYPSERWLDIRRLDVMRRLIARKFGEARALGCDAMLCDNTEAWITGTDGSGDATISLYRERGLAAVKDKAAANVVAQTGFAIGYDDQLRYNRLLAEEAHAQCLAIGLINDVFQIDALAADFDFALNEQCHHCGWCDLYAPFAAAGKPVLHLEFDDNEGFCGTGAPKLADICAANAEPARRTFSSQKRAASSKLHHLDAPQACATRP